MMNFEELNIETLKEDKEGNMAGNSNEDFIFYLKNFSLNK